MADFALWGSACETAFWPPGTFMRAYDANREAAIAGIIEADPVATFVRGIMAERSTWAGRASDLLRAHTAASVGTLNGIAGGREIHAPLLAGCGAARRSSGPSALRLLLAAKVEWVAASLG
jgi:hypothetical protein